MSNLSIEFSKQVKANVPSIFPRQIRVKLRQCHIFPVDIHNAAKALVIGSGAYCFHTHSGLKYSLFIRRATDPVM